MLPKHIYNTTAVKLLRTIDGSPGLNATELAKFSKSSYNTVVDYTHMMATMGLVTVARAGPCVRYNITPNGRQVVRCIDTLDELITASNPAGVSSQQGLPTSASSGHPGQESAIHRIFRISHPARFPHQALNGGI